MTYRMGALAIAAVCVAVAMGLPWLPVWLRAGLATHALVCVICAAWMRPPADPATEAEWVPAPPDPTILNVHREALNPVPAVARPPVDALLAEVIPARPTPMFATETGAVVATTELPTVDRVLAVERAVVTITERLDAYASEQNDMLNRFGELVAVKLDDLDRRIAALEANRPAEPLEEAR